MWAGRRCRCWACVAPCRCAAGWCGVFRGVRRLSRVRPSVGVPCFGVVVCLGAPWCVVQCSAVLRRAGPCCVVVRPALLCHVAPCGAAVCRAVPRRATSCCGVSCLGVPCGGVMHGGALRCGVPCCLVLCRGEGVGVGSVLVRLARRVEVLWLAGGWGVRLGVGWLAESVMRRSGCAARAGGSGRLPLGCPPWGPVLWSRLLLGSLPLALGAAAVSPSSSGACVVALAVAPGRRLAVRAWLWGARRCFRRLPRWV